MFKKLAQRKITQWNNLHLNFWAINKCGSTSMIFTLIHKNNPTNTLELLEQQFETMRWTAFNYHNVQWISEIQANSNNFLNFAIIRHPFARFLSMYKDIFLDRRYIAERHGIDPNLTLLEFATYLTDTPDEDLDPHFKSQSAFLLGSRNLMYFDLGTIHNVKTNFPKPELHMHDTKNVYLDISNVDKLKNLIYDRYQQDYKMLNYDPDSLDSE